MQITLIIIGILLAIMLGLLIWVIRITFYKKLLVQPPPKALYYSNPIKPKYANSKLQNGEKQLLLKKIIDIMEVEKIYRQSDLTIQQLASEIAVPKHYISQIINEQLDSGFIDFVNRYRVEEAKEKLQEEHLKGLSILVIGQQVGFHAKSTFYTAFKKYTNSTPAAFRKATLKSIKVNEFNSK